MVQIHSEISLFEQRPQTYQLRWIYAKKQYVNLRNSKINQLTGYNRMIVWHCGTEELIGRITKAQSLLDGVFY